MHKHRMDATQEARGSGGVDASAPEKQLDALQSAVDSLRSEINDSEHCLTQLASRDASARKPATALRERLDQLDQHLTDLEARRQELQGAWERLEDQRGELEQQSRDLAAKRQTLQDRLADSFDQFKRRDRELQDRAIEIERELHAAQNAQMHFEQRTQGFALRRERLHRYRRRLGERRREIQDQQKRQDHIREQCENLLDRRRELTEAHQLLEQSEQQMIRRWSTQRSLSRVAGVIIALAVVLGASFGIGYKFISPTWKALAVVQRPVTGFGNTAAWMAQQRRTMLSEQVLQRTLNVLRKQGIRPAQSVQQFRRRLEQHMTLSAGGQAGRVRIALRGRDRTLLKLKLDALTRAYLAADAGAGTVGDFESAHQARLHTAAHLASAPVKDRRMIWSLAIFGLGVVVLTGAVLLIRTLLIRKAPRETDQDLLNQVAHDPDWNVSMDSPTASESAPPA